MLARLLLLFITVPLIELFLLVQLGERIGLAATVALVVVTGILGASLARQQGLATWSRFQQESAAGRPPGRTLLDGLLILVAGAVLLTPGLLTDLTGFALLVPPIRSLLSRRLEGWLAGRVGRAVGDIPVPGPRQKSPPRVGPDPGAGGPVIEVEARVVRDAPETSAGTSAESSASREPEGNR